MVKIECHLCEKSFSLPKYIDTDKYEGEIVCPNCRSLLWIRVVKGKLQKRKFLKKQNTLLTYDELFKSARNTLKQHEKQEQERTKQ